MLDECCATEPHPYSLIFLLETFYVHLTDGSGVCAREGVCKRLPSDLLSLRLGEFTGAETLSL